MSAEEANALEEDIPLLNLPVDDDNEEETGEKSWKKKKKHHHHHHNQEEMNKIEQEEEEEIDEMEEAEEMLEEDLDEFMGEEGEEEEEKRISYQEMLDRPHNIGSPIELDHKHLKAIANELGLIKVDWPRIEDPEFEGRTQFPDSYLENSHKEKLLLLYTESFRRQFAHKYPTRKPLLLAAYNECGMQKMVCTTVRPTTLSYPEIETWQDCAKFVGTQVLFEPLEVPTLIPNRLYSPHTTFLRQSGQSYELATALCSLLIGLGYDAYVVSGYATRDITLRIMSRVDSPYPEQNESEQMEEIDETPKKYTVKPPRDLRSKFVLMMEQREIDKVKAEEEKIKEMERERMEEEEKPPPDELEGLRVHAWILLRKHTRNVEKDVFIEPSTGMVYNVNTKLYCGIETVWNNTNYWINMQDCSNGLSEIEYELTNVERWEHLLIGEPIQFRQTEVDLNMDDEERRMAAIMEEKHLDMPSSWSLKIHIPHDVLKNKFPNGQQTTFYKRTLVEEFAPYVQEDGLVTKLTRFEDFDCTVIVKIENLYENRKDKLNKVLFNIEDESTTEFFDRGRPDGVKKNFWCRNDRVIEFNWDARFDGLEMIEVNPSNMKEYYRNREDRLHYRESYYAKKGFPPPGMTEGIRKIIVKLIEKYNRNETLPASKDIAMREFAFVDRQIHIKYQYGKNKVTASTRTFLKPPVAEMGDEMQFNPELTYGYQAELGAKPPRHLDLFQLFEKLLIDEEKSIVNVHLVEDLVNDFERLRDQEISMPELNVSLYNREQNEQYRLGMLEREKQEKELRDREVEEEIEYLGPYLAEIGNPTDLTLSQAMKVRDKCLMEFKQLLIARANDLQKQFEQGNEQLAQRNQWYLTNQHSFKAGEELEYFEKTNELIFLLKTLEMRLGRQKNLSALRYEAMVRYLDNHPKLEIIRPPKRSFDTDIEFLVENEKVNN